jgi:AAA15 family ATPase/GTPase
MLKNITIENFRGFKKLDIQDSRKFNLIIGKNNVGKTALLEALFLHIGSKNPELPSKINIFRGIFPIPLKIESLWSPLFYNYDSSKVISVSSRDSKYKARKLEIKLASEDATKILQPKEKKGKEDETSITTSTIPKDRIELKYYDTRNNYSTSFAIMEKEGIRLENPKDSDLQGIFVLSRGKGGGSEDAERYAQLDVKDETNDIINILQKVEPRLKRLSVVPQGPDSNIYGDVGIGRAIPIQLMGEGTSKLLTLSLAITVVKDGIVLIDEIENGLHYSIMLEVFLAIKELAKKYNIQIFATTHSNECVHSIYEAYENSDSSDLSVIRLDRIDDEIKTVVYDKESLNTAFETGWEIRG